MCITIHINIKKSADIDLEDIVAFLRIVDFLIVPHLISTLIGLIRDNKNKYFTSVLIRHAHLLRDEFKDSLRENIKGADAIFLGLI